MTIEDIEDAIIFQSYGILTAEDARNALLAHGGISPQDVKGVTVTFTDNAGMDIAFEV